VIMSWQYGWSFGPVGLDVNQNSFDGSNSHTQFEVCGQKFLALVGFRGVGLGHTTKAATSAPSRALPRRRALCTNWKKPR
jgi:hypothetical protein